MAKANNSFRTPFSKDYWSLAFSEGKKTKMLVIVSLFVALRIALSQFFIPIPGINGQRIYFSFFINALGSMIYGPILGIFAGMISDLISALAMPTGPFFIGYTVTAMFSSFIYGLFLYKAKISVQRIFFCKLTVNLISNVCLNSLWRSILTGVDFKAMAILNLPKNIIMLPIETFLLFIFFKAITPALKKENII